MKLETVITANQKRFPQFTITKVVDVGNFCIVFVCDDEGCPPLQMPYKVTESGEVSGYDMFDEKLRAAYAAGKVIYLDETPLRDKPPANPPQNLATASVQAAKGDGNTSTPEDTKACVGVLVASQGMILTGTRKTAFGYGLIAGPGGHVKDGETPESAAFRETEEEFGISPKELLPLGRGPAEPETGIRPHVFLCTDYEGEPNCVDGEMADPQFRTLEEIELLTPSLFQPFADGVALMKAIATGEAEPDGIAPFGEDGGPGSGNFGHEGRAGEVGGSAPSLTDSASALLHGKSDDFKADFLLERGMRFREVNKAMQEGKLDDLVDEKVREIAKERNRVADKAPDDSKFRKLAEKASLEIRNEPVETLVAYDKDGNEIGRNTGGAQEVKNSESDATYSTLHNHPGDADSCFSGGDVRSFANTGEQVMYMTSTSKLYSLQKTSDYDGYSARSVATHMESLEKKYQDGDMTRNDLIAETDLYLQLHAHEFGLVYKQQDVSAKNVDTAEKTLDIPASVSTIKLQNTSEDGGPGSGNHGHEGVPGQVGGSAPTGKEDVTAFTRTGGKVTITSDCGIKRGKHGKATMLKGELSEVEDFAGVPGKKSVLVEQHLIEQYGGQPGSWRHTKGVGKVRTADGTEKLAEIHWFENDKVGQIKWKIKREFKEEQK